MTKRVIVTGGSGRAGRYVVQHLLDNGYCVLNLDRTLLPVSACRTLLTDITDGGQVFSALSSYMGFTDNEALLRPQLADAVVHFAAIPRMFAVADPEVIRVNVLGTHNIIEAALKLGIRKIILASSEAAYGFAYAEHLLKPNYFPVDEMHPLAPTDAYGLSKLLNEETARALAARSGCDMYALRIGDVVVPDDYQKFTKWFRDPGARQRIFWSYIDARDLGEIVRLAIENDGLGYQVFNATNNLTSSNVPTRDLLARFFPSVPVKRDLEKFETLLSNGKIREVLGFQEGHSWRRYVDENSPDQ